MVTNILRSLFLPGLAIATGAFLILDSSCRADKPVPKTAPAWTLKDVDGKTVHLSDFKGKVVILDFWATWCPPCRAEIPGFVELQKKYGDKGLVVVGVSVDEDGAKAVKPFMEKNGINYPIVLGDQRTSDAYGGIEAIPTTFIIDKSGKIVERHEGLTEVDEFEAAIKKLL